MTLTIIQTATTDFDSGIYAGTLTVSNDEFTENYWVEFEYDCEQVLSEQDLTPPFPKVKDATANGKIVIEWDKAMKVPADILID